MAWFAKRSLHLSVWVKIVCLKLAVLAGAGGLLLLDSASVQSSVSGWLGRLAPGHAGGVADFPGDGAGKDRDYLAINREIESLETDFPKDVIKAIAWCESEWSQVDPRTGKTFVTTNYRRRASGITKVSQDWGIMQINGKMESLDSGIWDLARIQSDTRYNLRAGVAVLKNKRLYVRHLKRQKYWPQLEKRYHLAGHDELEITLKAYNGFQPSWSYLRRVKRALATRPWDQAMKLQVLENTLGKAPQTLIRFLGDEVMESPLPDRFHPPIPAATFYQIEANIPSE